jgi:D-sedoheptulose 7-phosphate isomerase
VRRWKVNAMPNEIKTKSFINKEPQSLFAISLAEAEGVLASLQALESQLHHAAELCITAFRENHKVLACGNGGSACEAQHLVGELVGRYKTNRDPLPAIAMTSDTAVLTCIANDFAYEDIFARQVQALAQPGDVFVAFSTSGHSPNVLRALETARSKQVVSIAFLGRDGGAAATLADCPLIVPHSGTARIQEGHQFLMHSMMDLVEMEFALGS